MAKAKSRALQMAFVMMGKLAPSFSGAVQGASKQLKTLEKATKAAGSAEAASGLVASMKDVEKHAKVSAAAMKRNLVKSVQDTKKAFAGLRSEVMGTARAITGLFAANGLIGGAIYGVAKSSANYADQAIKSAQATGMQTAAFTELAYAAKMGGVSQEGFATASSKLNKQVQEALGGNQKAAEAFFRAGVSLRDANGQIKTTEQLYGELADVFAAMPDGIGKSSLAMALFGETGTRLIPMLNAGRAGINALRLDAQRLGVSLSEKDAKNAEAFNDSFTNIGEAVRGVSLLIGKQLWPVLTKVHEAVSNWITINGRMLAQEVPQWIAAAEEGWRELKPALEEAWESVKSGVRIVHSLAQGMGGWVPLIKRIIQLWLIYKGLRIYYEFSKALYSLGGLSKQLVNSVSILKQQTASLQKAVFWLFKYSWALIKLAAKGLWALVKGLAMAVVWLVKFSVTMAAKAIVAIGKFAIALVVKAIPALMSLLPAIWAVTAAAVKFGIALFANPIGLIIAAIAALTAAIIWCYYNWDTVIRWLTTAWLFWKDVAEHAFAAVSGAFLDCWESVKSVFEYGWNLLPGWMQDGYLLMFEMMSSFGEKALVGLRASWDMIIGFFSNRIDRVVTAFDEGFFVGIAELFAQFNLVSLVLGLLNSFVELITGFDIYSAGMDLIRRFGEGILSAWGVIRDEVASAIVDWIPGGADGWLGQKIFGSASQAATHAAGAALAVAAGVPAFAAGGVVRSPQLALVGEAGPEVIVPTSRPGRARSLLQLAGDMVGGSGGGRAAGAGGGVSIHFSPTINAPGGDGGQVSGAIERAYARFKRELPGLIDAHFARNQRLALR